MTADERPHREALVEAAMQWHETLAGTSGTGINPAFRLVLQRCRELAAVRLAARLAAVGNEPLQETT
jgi:hypothetical protein